MKAPGTKRLKPKHEELPSNFGFKFSLRRYSLDAAPDGSMCARCGQGLTPDHFSAQLEPCLTHKNTLHSLNSPSHPLNMGYTTPTRTPYPIKSALVELKGGRV